MREPNNLIRIFERNLMVIKRDLADMTHEQSLIQLPFEGNCTNWVVGHLAASRVRVLYWLDVKTDLLSDYHYERYLWGSEPILGKEEGLLRFEDGIQIIEALGEVITNSLNSITEDKLFEEVGEGDNKGLRHDRVEFMAWHEAYHTGQFEYLKNVKN